MSTAYFLPGTPSVGWPAQLIPMLPPPPPLNPAVGTSGSFVSGLGAVSQFINTTFPNVWATIKGQPLPTPSLGVSPQPQPPGPPATVEERSAQIQRWLLIAGVVVLGVAVALSLAKKQKAA